MSDEELNDAAVATDDAAVVLTDAAGEPEAEGAEDAAPVASDEVAEAVLDYRLDIPGRAVFPIRLDVARDPLASDTTGATTVTITDVYRLESEPGRDGS